MNLLNAILFRRKSDESTAAIVFAEQHRPRSSSDLKVTASGPGLGYVPVDHPVSFWVTFPDERWTPPTVEIMDPHGKPLHAEITQQSDELYKFHIHYTAGEIGHHRVSILVSGAHIPGSPFSIKAFDAHAVQLERVDRAAVVGQPCTFWIDATKAGAGEIVITVRNKHRELPIVIQPKGHSKGDITFTPEIAAEHIVIVKLNGVSVPGSPMQIPVTGAGKGAVKPVPMPPPQLGGRKRFSPDTDTVNEGSSSKQPKVTEEQHSSGKPLSELKPICLREMKVPKVHTGRYLPCRVIGEMCTLTDMEAAVVDINENDGLISFYNFSEDLDDAGWLKPGAILFVKEPYMKFGQAKNVMIRVDSPSDVVFVHPTNRELLTEAGALCWFEQETMRFEPLKKAGNEKFQAKNFKDAFEFYVRALIQTTDPSSIALIRNNMAAALLALGRFGEAKENAQLALDGGANRAKALFHLGKAAYGMSRWREAIDHFQSILEEDPTDETAKIEMEKAKARLRESETGEYDLNAFEKAARRGEPFFDLADYVGPVKVAEIPGIGPSVIVNEMKTKIESFVLQISQIEYDIEKNMSFEILKRLETLDDEFKHLFRHQVTFIEAKKSLDHDLIQSFYRLHSRVGEAKTEFLKKIGEGNVPMGTAVRDFDSSKVTVGDIPSSFLSEPTHFAVDVSKSGGLALDVQITGPNETPLPVRCYKQYWVATNSTSYWVEFTPEQCGSHLIEVTFADVPVAGSPFQCEVVDPRSVSVRLGEHPFVIQQAATVIVERNGGGSGQLTFDVSDPQGQPPKVDEVAIAVNDNDKTLVEHTSTDEIRFEWRMGEKGKNDLFVYDVNLNDYFKFRRFKSNTYRCWGGCGKRGKVDADNNFTVVDNPEHIEKCQDPRFK